MSHLRGSKVSALEVLVVVLSARYCHLDTSPVPMEQGPRDQPSRRALHPSDLRRR